MAAGRRHGKVRTVMYTQRIIRFTTCLVLGWDFRYFRLERWIKCTMARSQDRRQLTPHDAVYKLVQSFPDSDMTSCIICAVTIYSSIVVCEEYNLFSSA